MIGLFPVERGMTTDLVSGAIVGEPLRDELRQNEVHQVRTGPYENDTVCFVRPTQVQVVH